MGFFDFLSGLNPVTSVIGTAGKLVGSAASDLLDRFAPKRMTENERTELWLKELNLAHMDGESARQMFMVEMQTQRQPWVVRVWNGCIRPGGATLALGVFFFNILASNLARWTSIPFERVPLTEAEYYIISIIIVFYFGGRFLQKQKGTT